MKKKRHISFTAKFLTMRFNDKLMTNAKKKNKIIHRKYLQFWFSAHQIRIPISTYKPNGYFDFDWTSAKKATKWNK